MVQLIIEIRKIFFKYCLGIGNSHINIIPDNPHLNPLMSIGGNCSIPGLVTTNPIPHKKGTLIAKKKSLNGIKVIYFL